MKYFINGMLLLGAALCSHAGNMNPDKPNVLLIYYDDMGYSDVGAYDTNQVSYTPHLDAFAAEGMRFTAGHSADAVCTPSRYALMTGRYCWRTSLKTHVLGGYSSPLMAADRLTIGKMFQDLGYETAMVGKWHVGMQFYAPDGSAVSLGNDSDVLGTNTASTADDEIDFSLPLTRTPNANGFDYYFGTAASLDMPPYTWIENQTVLFKGGLVTNGTVVFSQARPAVNGDFLEGEPIGAVNNVRDGVYDPNFVCSDYLQVQAAKVAEILALRAADDAPFFIYVPVPAPHLPWAVQEAFSGTAPFAYGDYLAQTDHYTGQILDALADRGLAGNTVVLITSDNGPSKNAMPSSLSNGHDCNGPFRGQKLDNWEGGTRVPFMIRWPALIAPGATTTHFCWQGDFLATMAEFLNYDLTPDQAPDAESFLSVLKGEAMPAARRPATIQHAYNGQCAIVDQDGVWKLLDGTGGNGSNSYDSQNNPLTSAEAAGVIFGSPRQLFNLSTDPGEDHNLLSTTPTQAALDKEAQLYALLNEIRGNTTYGTDGDSNVPPIDTDGDGIPSYFERATEGLDRADPSDAAKDFDGDKLSNLLEYENESDLYDADTDGDRLEDGLEVLTYGSRPNRPHSDTDSLEDGDEVLIWGTDPVRADTDGDGVDDDDELEGFSNPRNAGSTAVTTNIVVALDPDVVQLAGYNGTVDDPDDEEGGDDWAGSGTLFVRSRATNRLEEKTRCFLRFDLSGIPQNIESARLRIHQIDRLNDSNTGDLQLARVTDFWDAAVGSYPLFDGTGVTNGFVLGNNGDFGLDVDASGFYSGTVGVPGTDAGFDVTAMVQAWCEGTAPNYGFRIAFDQTGNVGAAFSTEDDPLTIGTNEAPQLMVTALEVVSADADNDRLRDAYELEMFGGLSQSGTNDFDGDGVNNLIEQALGSDPTGSNSVPVYSIILTNETEVAFSYRRCNQAGLGIEVLVSNNLTNWNAYTEYYAETASAAEPGADYETVLLEAVDGTPDHLFYRISVHALDRGTATDSTNAPFSGVLALYDAQADTNGNFNTGSFDSVDPDVTTTAARLVQGGSLNGGGQNKYVLTRAVFDASASGSPGFNFAGTALADQRAATGAGDWFAFTLEPNGNTVEYERLAFYSDQYGTSARLDIGYTIGTTETFVLRNYLLPANDAPVERKEIDFTDFSSAQDVTWTFYLYGAAADNHGSRFDDIALYGSH